MLRGAKERGGADKYAGDHGQDDDREAVGGCDVFGFDDDSFPKSGKREIHGDAAEHEADDTPDDRNAVIGEQLDFLHLTPVHRTQRVRPPSL